jgi:outer membrane protein
MIWSPRDFDHAPITHGGTMSTAKLLAVLAFLVIAAPLGAQVNTLEAVTPGQPRVLEMTLETMTTLALSDGYRVRFLNMNIEQTAWELRAERARLRSSVDLEFSAPVWSDISQEHFNPELGRNEIFRENELRVEGELSIRQPVILFGFPTNGYLSLNNSVYRVAQRETDGERDVEYYNRYFIQYTQPLFQPNELRNSLEEAELDLESEEIDYYENILELVDDVSQDYFSLFETAYNVQVADGYVADLRDAEAAAQIVVQNNPTRSIELDQIRVELANAEEQLGQSQTDLRRQYSDLRTELNIPTSDSIMVDPTIDVVPIQIDVERAVQFAQELAPSLRRLRIQEREREISLDEVRGRNAFQVDLEFTYGREMRNPYFDDILQDPENTYTVDVNASVPLWDWGERDARIEASRVNLRRSVLQMEEANVEIVTDVQNEIQDVLELQARAVSMEANLVLAQDISAQTLARYREGSMTALDLLQTLQRELDTAENLLEAYVGWRESIQGLQELTYYDFELDVPVMERYGIDVSAVAGLEQD